MWPKLAAVVLAGTLLGLSVRTTFAQTPTSTPTPPATPTGTPTTTPSLLAAPDQVSVDQVFRTGLVTWRDNASGEEGYRIVVKVGSETRTFVVGPDVEQLLLPADFRPGCPSPGASIFVSVTAFLGESESEPGRGGLASICADFTSTPPPGLRNSNSGGPATWTFAYGLASDTPLPGDWNDNGTDTPGVRRDGQ